MKKIFFWHIMLVECGRPHVGSVSDCMRRSKASYHYSMRQVKKDENAIIKQQVLESFIRNPRRDFWAEFKKI